MSGSSMWNNDLLEDWLKCSSDLYSDVAHLQFDDKTAVASAPQESMQEVGGDLLYDVISPTPFEEPQSLLTDLAPNFDLLNWNDKEGDGSTGWIQTDNAPYNDSNNAQNPESLFVTRFSDHSVNDLTPLSNAIPADAATLNIPSIGINSAKVGDVSFGGQEPIIISVPHNTSWDSLHVGNISTSPLSEPTARQAAGKQSLGKIRKCSRRRIKNSAPKTKLYEVDEPFSDADEEKKRQNAKKAHKNREIQKKKVDELNALIDTLRHQLDQKDAQLRQKDTLIFQKDTLILQMKQEQERDIQQLIEQLQQKKKDLEDRK